MMGLLIGLGVTVVILCGCLIVMSFKEPKRTQVAPLASPKEDIERLEREVFAKVDEIQRIANSITHDIDILSLGEDEQELRRSTDTAIMKAINRNVQEVEKMADEKRS